MVAGERPDGGNGAATARTGAGDPTAYGARDRSAGGSVANPEAPPQGGSSRLERRTHLNQGHWVAKRRNYGDGLVEVSMAFAGVPLRNSGGSARGNSTNKAENRERACRRAKSKFRQRCMALRADRIVTLTYRRNELDIGEAWNDFRQFTRKLRRELQSWPYVAVAERQKRGAIHFHIAVRGWQPVALLRRTWRSVVGEGNIDVTNPRRKSRCSDGRWHVTKLVAYLVKYLTKAFADKRLNENAYRASMITIPEEVRILRSHSVFEALNWLREASDGKVGYLWEEEGSTRIWACSWE